MNDLINEAKGVINCSYSYKNVALAWTGGKESTLILHMIYEMYDGVSFKVFFNDTGDSFEEARVFMNNISNKFSFPIIEFKNSDKVQALNQFINTHEIDCLITGIRRDEHPARKDETSVSPRDNHVRLHPVLNWTEKDIWSYTHANNIPFCSLYAQGYRTFEGKSTSKKIDINAPERSGRELTKEQAMHELRKAGYY